MRRGVTIKMNEIQLEGRHLTSTAFPSRTVVSASRFQHRQAESLPNQHGQVDAFHYNCRMENRKLEHTYNVQVRAD